MDHTDIVPKLASRIPEDEEAAAAYLLELLGKPEVGLTLTPDQRGVAQHLLAPFLAAFGLKTYRQAITRDDPTRDMTGVIPGDGWHQPEHHRHGHAPRWNYCEDRPLFIADEAPPGVFERWRRRKCCGQTMRRVRRVVLSICGICRIREWHTTPEHYVRCNCCGSHQLVS